MGKVNKKGHNWKARKQKEVSIDRNEEQNIKLDQEIREGQQCDDANVLALPSQKRATKIKGEQPLPVKRLSKKQRKQLEKVLEQKEKKKKRAGLLEALKSVQVSQEELAQLHSTTQLHNQTFKRRLEQSTEGSSEVNALSGSRKKCKREPIHQTQADVSSSESSDTEDEAESDVSESADHQDEILALDTKTQDVSHAEKKDKIQSPDISEEKMEAVRSRANPAVEVTHVPVTRDPSLQIERLKLPILGEEQIIMEKITENAVTILCGETGSGKTTQVPQFLYEAGYAIGNSMIAITEPRRVAAISMAQRVAAELNLTNREVSYQIRYEGNVTPHTKIKFLTDGVLLKEVQKDFLLNSYSVVVIDEAHERSMYTDILIGLLSRIVPLRQKKGKPLKLIIMSATLRVEDFTENNLLFKTIPPVVKVDSRQYPVTVHFNKRTPQDYLNEAFKKVCKIHKQLPEGGILVFVTGQQEVHTLCARLRRIFPYNPHLMKAEEDADRGGSASNIPAPKVSLDDYSIVPEDEQAEIVDIDKAHEESDVDDDNLSDDMADNESLTKGCELPIYTLPLYSLLSTKKQQRVFQPPPPGCRLCVVATNVAETSITIPGIRYVVDTGKTKTRFYDKVTGVSAFQVTWTAQASANQRAGRAGRTGPGHCYRLYSSAVFSNDFEQFSPPEIVRRPIDDLVLQMKAMCIDKVVNFPFPSPPGEESLKAAEVLLTSLGALELVEKGKSARVTSLGKTMAAFPVAPRYGKILSLGQQHGLLAYVVALVAALSVQELLVEPHVVTDDDKEVKKNLSQLKRSWAGVGESLLLGDMAVLLHAVGACEYAGGTEQFCAQNHIRYKAMVEVRKLRRQLTNTVNTVLPEACLAVDPKLSPPGELQCKLLRQILLAGFGDRVARKMPAETLAEDGKKAKLAYKCTTTDDIVFIHPSSVLYKHQPQYVIYQSLEETSKLYMKGITVIDLDWLPVFAPTYCTFSKPLDDPPPSYDSDTGQVVCHMTSTFGPHSWPVPAVEISYPSSIERYRWFARFLLDGSVCPTLKKYSSSLLSLPVTMIKSWAKLQPRTESLLRALTFREVYCRDSLLQAWNKDSKYLLPAYKEWLPEALRLQIDSLWPPMKDM